MEKQRDKAAKRQQRKLDKDAPADESPESGLNDEAEDGSPMATPAGELLDG